MARIMKEGVTVVNVDEKYTYIDEIVVQTPHDSVSEFIERTRQAEAMRTHPIMILLSHPRCSKLQDTPHLRRTKKLQKQEKTLFLSRFVETLYFQSHSALPNINIKDCTQITFNFHY